MPDPIESRDWTRWLQRIREGDQRLLARAISLIENDAPGYAQLLEHLAIPGISRVTGITGPPGAGKSCLADQLIAHWTAQGKSVAVICVDPSSPFHAGALLGDRLRMSRWYASPAVFIRSLSSRGAVGGLNPKIIEITDLLKGSGFDHILVETVGVGQNEVDIAGLADTTVVVLMPGSGDDIQAMKSGVLDIADIFVVNKSDLPNADELIRYLLFRQALGGASRGRHPAILKTVAVRGEGVDQLAGEIDRCQRETGPQSRALERMAEKAWRLILHRKMQMIDRNALREELAQEMSKPGFNLYSYVANY